MDLVNLSKQIVKSHGLKPYENLKELERLSTKHRSLYGKLLSEISFENQHLMNQQAFLRISHQVDDYLEDGINIKPTSTGLSNSAILYKLEEAEILDILFAIEIGEIHITKAPKKTLTHLYEALWAGITDELLPLKWSKSTKWQ